MEVPNRTPSRFSGKDVPAIASARLPKSAGSLPEGEREEDMFWHHHKRPKMKVQLPTGGIEMIQYQLKNSRIQEHLLSTVHREGQLVSMTEHIERLSPFSPRSLHEMKENLSGYSAGRREASVSTVVQGTNHPRTTVAPNLGLQFVPPTRPTSRGKAGVDMNSLVHQLAGLTEKLNEVLCEINRLDRHK